MCLPFLYSCSILFYSTLFYFIPFYFIHSVCYDLILPPGMNQRVKATANLEFVVSTLT
jgi:hypothetical protein